MRILLVDDEPNLVRTLRRILERKGHVVTTASDGQGALLAVERGGTPDVVVTDLKMPNMDGMALLRELRGALPELPIVLLTGQATVQTAVEAMKLGAFDYLIKPCNPDELLVVLDRATEFEALRREVRVLRQRVSRYEPPVDFVGASRALREVRTMIDAVATKKATVLITGESGTGKELVAREIHRRGCGPGTPFLPINCGALSDTLLESQLFGHRRGSFTGAISDHDGFFKAATGGMLFLDEVSEMPLPLQVKLLRAVQYREIIPIGSTTPEVVDARIVAATNRQLEHAVARGTFREDLFYRLNVVNIHIPPLRERPEDVEELVRYFIAHYARTYEVAVMEVEPDAMRLMRTYPWPGNVRELQNVVERAFVLSPGATLGPEALPPAIRIGAHLGEVPRPRERGATAGLPAPSKPSTLVDLERQRIIEALREANGRKVDAARKLGIDRKRLYRKIKKYGIEAEHHDPNDDAPAADRGETLV